MKKGGEKEEQEKKQQQKQQKQPDCKGRGPSTTPPFWILNHCMKVQRPVFLPHVYSN